MGIYDWASGATPPPIEPHSIAKHRVYAEYVQRYIRIYTTNHRVRGLRLALVDGFAGGGLYRTGAGDLHEGSPLQLLRAVSAARAELNQRRGEGFPLEVRFYFVEADRGAYDFLQGALRDREFLGRGDVDPVLFHGTFEQHAPAIIQDVRSRLRSGRSIFFLDQYGYKDVLLPTLKRGFTELENIEVVLTLATDWIFDFLADTPDHVKALSALELAPRDLLQFKDGPDWRRRMERYLHDHIWRRVGCQNRTPFFIESADAHRAYSLIHLSKHPKACDEMKRLHWDVHTFAHYGGPGLDMLGYRSKTDAVLLPQQRFGFGDVDRQRSVAAMRVQIPQNLSSSGKTVSWRALVAQIVNETPAWSGIAEEAVLAAVADKDLVLAGAGGSPRSTFAHLNPDDLISYNRQVRMSFAGG